MGKKIGKPEPMPLTVVKAEPSLPAQPVGGAPAVTVQTLLEREAFLDELAIAVLKVDVHFGVIPGCNKPSLYKAGAEKLSRAFGLRKAPPTVQDLSGEDEVRLRVIQPMVDGSGAIIATGIGECSSREDKYHWRKVHSRAEWNATPPDRRKIKYGWKGEDQVVRVEPADVANTVAKMAEKRAYTQAVLYATGTSDRFTVDIEDMPRASHSRAAPRAKVGDCPDCGKPLRIVNGKNGQFVGCSGYRDGCKYTRDIPPEKADAMEDAVKNHDNGAINNTFTIHPQIDKLIALGWDKAMLWERLQELGFDKHDIAEASPELMRVLGELRNTVPEQEPLRWDPRQEEPCPECNGEGQTGGVECPRCKGTRFVQVSGSGSA